MKIHPSADWVIFSFGKYKGYSLSHILKNDPNYSNWILDKEGFSNVWKEAIRRARNNEDISDLKLPRKVGASVGSVGESSFEKKVIQIVEKNDTTAKLLMPYDANLINRFKSTIDGRKWDEVDRCWEFPIVQLPRVVELINAYEIKVTPVIKELYQQILEDQNARLDIREKTDTDFEIEGLKLDLYPYQKIGVEFANQTNGRCLIADQPGLGKTAQAIAYAQMNGLKTLVVCPLAVLINWKKEINKFTGKDTCIWSSKGKEGHSNLQFHAINYDAVRKVSSDLHKLKFDLLICDEATYLKNRNTLRFKSLLGSYKERKQYPGLKTDHVIFLTGTPVMSRPVEAFTLLNFLDNNRFNNFYHFTQRYGGWRGSPPKNLSELHERTKELVIRRKKSEVLSELPDKQRNDLYVKLEPSERREYDKLLDELFGEWRFSGKPTIGTMPKIQSYLIDQKLPRLKEIIDEYLDNDESILIFCCYIEPLERLKKLYDDDAALYHGSMKKEEREIQKDRLKNGEARVGLFSLKAAGMGIDGLQHKINTVVFLDMDWVPANHEQAEDRTHRIGQKNQVQAYYMICDGTIDEYMRDILAEKQNMASQIVDGEIMEGINNKSFFNEFIKRVQWQKNL
ncbi:MAG: SNF2-related protein [Betaproteobacteria bacterium]